MKFSTVIKRMLSLTLVVTLLALTAAPALAASKPSGAYVVVTSSKHNRLKVRSSDGTVKAHLKPGTVVVYKGNKKGWWKVQYRGGSGYVDKTYLVSVASLPNAKYTAVDNLWVRTKPKSGAQKMGKLKAGKKVIITGQKGTWVSVANKSYSGWVPAKYLTCVGGRYCGTADNQMGRSFASLRMTIAYRRVILSEAEDLPLSFLVQPGVNHWTSEGFMRYNNDKEWIVCH